jgi:hypothetical protein
LAIFISKISLLCSRETTGFEGYNLGQSIFGEGSAIPTPKEIDGTATYESKKPTKFLKEEVSSCGERWLLCFSRVTLFDKEERFKKGDWDFGFGVGAGHRIAKSQDGEPAQAIGGLCCCSLER